MTQHNVGEDILDTSFFRGTSSPIHTEKERGLWGIVTLEGGYS
jgi:hypothetical protein